MAVLAGRLDVSTSLGRTSVAVSMATSVMGKHAQVSVKFS